MKYLINFIVKKRIKTLQSKKTILDLKNSTFRQRFVRIKRYKYTGV